MEADISQKCINQSLTTEQAKDRLKQYGENIVYRREKFRPIIAFVKKFNSPLLLILIGASLISFFVGEHLNALILLLMILISATLEFINSYKSEKAVQDLISRVVVTATVVRDCKIREIEFKNIVPGDIIFLSPGDVVPADSIILESNDLFVNQAVLTGESFPVEKNPDSNPTDSHNLSAKASNLVLMGTSIVTGFATVKVVRTGESTEFGKIAETLVKAEAETDFNKNIRRFSYFIMQLTIVLVSFVFLANALLGHGWLTSFIFAIAIAIGLTPELLPVIISVSLSHGSIKMAAKDVIVKNLPSIQNFGSMNILCTDKTGTLTKDKIELIKYIDLEGNTNDNVLLFGYLNSYFHAGIQNPLDNAIKEYKKLNIAEYKKIEEVPFDFERKRLSVVAAEKNKRVLIAKGAPESIFEVCNRYRLNNANYEINESIKSKIQNQFNILSLGGFRTLAIAYKEIETKNHYYKTDENDLVFLGFVAFLDPPKDGVTKAIFEFEKLGIELKIITGDNEILTEKICKDIKLDVKGIILGSEIDKMTDLELQRKALATTIFARINPEQKERIIINLKKAKQVVGYLGDGINDAPALKAADVGISVNNAVDVAKDTADIILLKKSLLVLKDGVIEGRKTFHNTMKYIMMGLSSNFGNMFSMMGASALLPFLPMLPQQVLLNNFIYDTSQLSLPSDNVDDDDVKKPTAWSFKFIRRYILIIGPISSIFDFLTFGVLYYVFHFGQSQFQTGWFIESIATQVFVIYIIRTKKIPFLQSKPSLLLLINTLIAVIVAWVIPYIFIGQYFQFAPLPITTLLVILSMVVIYLVIVEFVKRWFYKRYANI